MTKMTKEERRAANRRFLTAAALSILLGLSGAAVGGIVLLVLAR